VKEVKVPTASIWILARTYSTGTPEDYKEVWALQDPYKLYPLSAWGKDYTPPPGAVDPGVDMKRSVRAGRDPSVGARRLVVAADDHQSELSAPLRLARRQYRP
jgi:hypothetical protein